MDKKKKIIIGSVVAVALLAVVIGFGVSSNNKDEDGNKIDSNSQVSDGNQNDDKGQESNEQPEIKPALGSSFDDFEEAIEKMGYSLFEAGTYDLVDSDRSIAIIQISSEEVILNLKEKEFIDNEKIIETLKILIPNESETISNYIKNETDSIAMSLDNRTVSIEFDNNEVDINIRN